MDIKDDINPINQTVSTLSFPTVSFESLLQRSSIDYAETSISKVLTRVPSLSVNGPWLAGGAIRRTLLNEQVTSDFDFFFSSEAQMLNFASVIENNGATLVSESKHQSTYTLNNAPTKIQLVHIRYYESASEVIDSFDYTICQFAFDGKTLTYGEFSLWDLARKRLVVHKITYPVASMRRLLKYQSQNFYACAGCLSSVLRATHDDPALMSQLEIAYVD